MTINGRLSPGEKLNLTVLAQKFGVPHTPVRESIRALAAVLLIDTTGQQGAEVA